MTMTMDPKIRECRQAGRLTDEQVTLLMGAIRAAGQAREAVEVGAPPEQFAQVLRDGAAAREIFIEANRGLVIKTARSFAGRGVPVEDLVQEGMSGLVKAVDRFDPDRGNRFSTHAMPWIKQGLYNALNTNRLVRRPVHVENTLRKVHAVRALLAVEFGRDGTDVEVAHRAGVAVREVERLSRVDAPEVSLDGAFEDGPSLSASIPSVAAATALARVERREDLKALDRAVAGVVHHLPALEAQVLTVRFGLGGGQPVGLAQAAERLGLDRATVRSAEMRALSSLRGSDAVRAGLTGAAPTLAA